MRAVARGLFLDSLPQCPERCGGKSARASQLSAEKQRHRVRHGCDADIPEGERCWYAIRCPRCDGAAAAGHECALCDPDIPGFMRMRRCPHSFLTPDIEEAIESLAWLQHGVLPGDGGLSDQAVSFIEFKKLFEFERHEVQQEQRKEG